MTIYLKEDVSRTHKKVKVDYGKKGDKVTVISERGEVFIVESGKKERFSIRKDKTYLT